MDSAKYIGMDVHKETVSIAVMNYSFGPMESYDGETVYFTIFDANSLYTPSLLSIPGQSLWFWKCLRLGRLAGGR
jgi:hypothetical protein